MRFIPKEVHKNILEGFNYSLNTIYCQVASAYNEELHIRTMRLYDITKDGELLFFSSTATKKWEDWQNNPSAAICFFNQNFGQIILHARASIEKIPDKINHYWKSLDESVKSIYLNNNSFDIQTAPANFGVIYITPYQWEVLKMNQQNYLASSKVQYQFENQDWKRVELGVAS